jgi:hypothetical protein
MGAGKSEIASRWWDQGLTEASRGDAAAVPLWIPARQLTDLRAQAEPVLAPAYGQARIVIDDLDSVTAQRAAEILDEARELVRAHPTVSILATSRLGIIPYPSEVLVVEPWPADKGADLAQLASGTELPWEFWAPKPRNSSPAHCLPLLSPHAWIPAKK